MGEQVSKPLRLAGDYTDAELRRMFAGLPLGRMTAEHGKGEVSA